MPIIVVTSGEPAGIGPQLCMGINPANFPDVRIVILGDKQLLMARKRGMPHAAPLMAYEASRQPAGSQGQNSLEVLDIPLAVPSQPGQLNIKNADYVLALLDRAIAGCQSTEFAAMVTAPVHKGVIADAGYTAFTGHTEYLAQKTAARHVVMMLAGACSQVAPNYVLRVALATTHLPLNQVSAAITTDSLCATLHVLHRELRQKFALPAPRILVAGLNPHAGEGGHLGREEIELMIPLLDKLRAEGMQLIGPLPADTLFNPSVLAQGDAVLAMYHDQGLPVLKHATFGHGVNITLGLPWIRTSVDHGTALALAAQSAELQSDNQADGGSLYAAIQMAVDMLKNRS